MPVPLALLLVAVATAGVAWALLVPPFQAPDESSHFAYAQSLVERGHLPGDPGRRLSSSEQELAAHASNSDQTASFPETKPEWSVDAYERWRDAERSLPAHGKSDAGGPIASATNPPLYYMYEAPPYVAASAGDIFDRLYVMRLWSVSMLLATTLGAWLLAGELFGRDRLLQLVAAAVAGLHPMVTFISTSVNPDAMLFALWSLAFWLGVRILRRGLATIDAVALFGIVGLGVVTKGTGYALLPAAIFVLVVGAVRRRAAGGTVVAALVAATVAFAIPVGAWLTTAAVLDRPATNEVATGPYGSAPTITSFSVRDLGSYLWQFYLPRLPFQEHWGGLPDLPVYNIWIKQGWAAFGWLEVRFPTPVYLLLALVSLGALTGSAWFAGRRWPHIDLAVVAFFGIAFAALLAGLHWTEFRTLVSGTGPFNQGRYLLPLIALGGAAVSATVALLSAQRRPAAAALTLGGLFALQLFSLSLVAARFYA